MVAELSLSWASVVLQGCRQNYGLENGVQREYSQAHCPWVHPEEPEGSELGLEFHLVSADHWRYLGL